MPEETSRLARIGVRASYVAAAASVVSFLLSAFVLPEEEYTAAHTPDAVVLLVLAGSTAAHISAAQKILGEGAVVLEMLTTLRCIVEVGAASTCLSAVRAYWTGDEDPFTAHQLHRFSEVSEPVAQLLAGAWIVALIRSASPPPRKEARWDARWAARVGYPCATALLLRPAASLFSDATADAVLGALTYASLYPAFVLLVGRSIADRSVA